MERWALVGAAAAAGLCFGCASVRRRRRRPMPSGAVVVWEIAVPAGAVRVTDDGLWAMSTFCEWGDVAYGVLEGDAAAHPSVVVHLVDDSHIPIRFHTHADAMELMRYFRGYLYPGDPHTIHVVLNPVAGGGNAQALYDSRIRRVFEASPHTVVMYTTDGRGHAEALVPRMVLAPGDVIACVSGTGVLSEVVNAVMRHEGLLPDDVTVAIIPVGPANGVAVSLGITSPVQAAKAIASKHTARVDVIQLTPVVTTPRSPVASMPGGVEITCASPSNASASEVDAVAVHTADASSASSVSLDAARARYGVLAFTAGIAAEVGFRGESFRWLGRYRYTLPALCQILRRPEYYLSFSTPAQPQPRPPSSLVTYFVVASLPYLRDGWLVAPSARSDDGLLHAQWIPGGHATARNLLKLFRLLATGAHVHDAGTPVQALTTREITVDVDFTQKVMLDGELVESAPCHLAVLPSRLNFAVPHRPHAECQA